MWNSQRTRRQDELTEREQVDIDRPRAVPDMLPVPAEQPFSSLYGRMHSVNRFARCSTENKIVKLGLILEANRLRQINAGDCSDGNCLFDKFHRFPQLPERITQVRTQTEDHEQVGSIVRSGQALLLGKRSPGASVTSGVASAYVSGNRPRRPPTLLIVYNGAMETAIVTFDTTHHALWAEELAKEREIPHEVVSAPPAANARCSIAIEILRVDIGTFSALLKENAISSRIYDQRPLAAD